MSTDEDAALVQRAVQRLTREITQEQIKAYHDLKAACTNAYQALKEQESELKAYETFYLKALESGYTQETGDMVLTVQELTRQAPIAWKEEFARVAGPKAVEQVAQGAGKKTYKHVVAMPSPQAVANVVDDAAQKAIAQVVMQSRARKRRKP